jgi:hypothetical protein
MLNRKKKFVQTIRRELPRERGTVVDAWYRGDLRLSVAQHTSKDEPPVRWWTWSVTRETSEGKKRELDTLGEGLSRRSEREAAMCADAIADVVLEPSCRICGCTEENACEGGCSWVEADLCSACAPDVARAEKKSRRRARRGAVA